MLKLLVGIFMFGSKKSDANRKSKSNSLTYLGKGSELQGTLLVEGNLRVDGRIQGTVEVEGDIEVSVDGSIQGPEVRGENLNVHGSITANIIAEGKLTLTRTARLEGDIVANALDIAAGAFYVGHIVTRDAKSLPSSPNTPRLTGSKNQLLG